MPSLTPDLFDSAPAPAARPAALSLVPVTVQGGLRQAARELWLCLWLPGLPLAALGVDPAAAGPVCVVEGDGSRQHVLALNAAASRQGISPGLGLNAALALCPGLEVLVRQPAAEADLLGRAARWATRFTPVVSLEPPQALLLEVRGSLGLFGGAARLCRLAVQELAGQGLVADATLAPTPRAALWMARAGLALQVRSPDDLPALATRLPLACLGWPPAVMRTLVALGVRSLADLARLPRDGFARRFGPRLLDELDEGFGRRPQPRRRAAVPERFDGRVELPAETASTALLGAALEQLLGRLQAFLRARAAGTAGLVLEFAHRDRPATRCRLWLARPGDDAAHFAALWRERLARTPLAAPAVSLRLRSTVAIPLELRPRDLSCRAGDDDDLEAPARLLERLRARLGSDAVFGVCLVPEHRPELAWCVAEPATSWPAGAVAAAVRHGDRHGAGAPPGGMPAWMDEAMPRAPRPLWMLAGPERLRERDGVPWYDGQALELVTGPERIETGWWDGRDVRRDYYVATGRYGVRLWVYRERAHGGGWWLHGVFG